MRHIYIKSTLHLKLQHFNPVCVRNSYSMWWFLNMVKTVIHLSPRSSTKYNPNRIVTENGITVINLQYRYMPVQKNTHSSALSNGYFRFMKYPCIKPKINQSIWRNKLQIITYLFSRSQTDLFNIDKSKKERKKERKELMNKGTKKERSVCISMLHINVHDCKFMFHSVKNKYS